MAITSRQHGPRRIRLAAMTEQAWQARMFGIVVLEF
jgi:hypothetical protein